MLRLAVEKDRPEIIRMALAFKAKSPYAKFHYDLEKINKVIDGFLKDQTEYICILSVDSFDKPHAMLSGVAAEPMWSFDRHAAELIWWVDPDYRRGRLGLLLKGAFEYWAWKVGCKIIQMTHLEQDDPTSKSLGKYYLRNGYRLVEQSYIKRIR